MNRRRRDQRSRAGFTLLEVMVAVAILATALTTLLMFSGNTMIKSGRAEALAVATMLARQRMTEIEISLIEAGKKNEIPDERSESGTFEDPFGDYSWTMEIKKVELPAPVAGEEGSIQSMVAAQLTKEIAKTVRELRLTVNWQDMGQEQTFDVITHIVRM
ncbi:MAG: type II secretion system protein [Proteobacteria bacterium]|nr:type II secretion system protein [Pseudomonadota bacterium]